MTAPQIIDPAGLLGQAVTAASPDLMRHLLSTVINSLLSAEADAVCGAEYGAISAGSPASDIEAASEPDQG
jgi:putative transposase